MSPITQLTIASITLLSTLRAHCPMETQHNHSLHNKLFTPRQRCCGANPSRPQVRNPPFQETPLPNEFNQGWEEYLGDEVTTFQDVSLAWEHEGGIPTWMKGSYIKNGPARRQFGTDDRQYSSYLDSWGKLHKFSFNEGKVRFSGRMIETANYNKSVAAGKMVPTLTLAQTLPEDWSMTQTLAGLINNFDNTNVMLWKLGPEDKFNGQVGKSFYYWMECIYTVENTFKTSCWDRLAGIAMVLKGGFGRGS